MCYIAFESLCSFASSIVMKRNCELQLIHVKQLQSIAEAHRDLLQSLQPINYGHFRA